MDKSNTSLEFKFSLEVKKPADTECIQSFIDANEIKGKRENQSNIEDLMKRSIFWKMHLKRKSGLEEMNRYVEDLVKQCLFWKRQLEGLIYQNRLLESEKRSLRDDYEELLEKTKHDMRIILKLKDSKKKLDHETEKYFRTDRELTTMKFANTDLRSDKLLLESKKNELLDSMKKNIANMKKINEIHKRIQSLIEKEKKREKRNGGRYKEELRKLNETLGIDKDIFEKFKKVLADHEQPIADLKSFLDIGFKVYLGLDSNEDEGKESPNEDLGNKSETETELETTVSRNGILKTDEQVFDNLTLTEQNIFKDCRKNKIIYQLTEKENSHLLKTYDYLYNIMNDLNERYMELTTHRNLKETEMYRYMEKAEDLYNVVMQKRRKFPFPPEDDRVELKIRIQTQINEINALRELLSLCASYMNEDLQFHVEFTNAMKEFYTPLLHQIEPETKSPRDTEKETISDASEKE